jgi:hypothetical protein
MIHRYVNTRKIRGGSALGTPGAARAITKAVQENRITLRSRLLKEGERLDTVAGSELGDARMWWIIAACSEIGWALQAPPGTLIKIPVNLSEIKKFTG